MRINKYSAIFWGSNHQLVVSSTKWGALRPRAATVRRILARIRRIKENRGDHLPRVEVAWRDEKGAYKIREAILAEFPDSVVMIG